MAFVAWAETSYILNRGKNGEHADQAGSITMCLAAHSMRSREHNCQMIQTEITRKIKKATHRKGGIGMAGGRPKKEAAEKYVKQNITMEPEQLKRLMLYCQKEDRSMSWVIRQALEMYLEKVA